MHLSIRPFDQNFSKAQGKSVPLEPPPLPGESNITPLCSIPLQNGGRTPDQQSLRSKLKKATLRGILQCGIKRADGHLLIKTQN